MLDKAIYDLDLDAIWTTFTQIAESKEWGSMTDNDIARAMRVFNNRFAFDYEDGAALNRAEGIVDICRARGRRFTTTFPLNECIRTNIGTGNRAAAYAIKQDMDAGTYGPEARTDALTYTAIFNDPHATGEDDLVRLVELYDEMRERQIDPNSLAEKPLIRISRRSREFLLLEQLLKGEQDREPLHVRSPVAARIICNSAQGYIAMGDLRTATALLHRLLMYPIPRKTLPSKAADEIYRNTASPHIPYELSGTREGFFVYLRSLYESLMRAYLKRRNWPRAHGLLDDMRRTIHLPPTRMAYDWFIRYHAKRKNIQKLHDIHDMMLQDGVVPDEKAYTKFITSCMFAPKQHLLNTLAARSKRDKAQAGTSELEPHHSSSPAASDKPPRSGLPEIPTRQAELEHMKNLVFHPSDCISFFQDMLLDYGVRIDDIRDPRFVPNVNITNSVMRAYLALEKPVSAQREFFRYTHHQRRLYPQQQPPELAVKRKTMLHVCLMALEAASLTRDRKIQKRIHTQMLLWGLRIPTAN
ncbi:hypothetical protein GGF46_002712 [Coemansia sp. RSA 552]|nr:hypothetical protein GGF46_002712 [Coemansia sp. RSA 552]